MSVGVRADRRKRPTRVTVAALGVVLATTVAACGAGGSEVSSGPANPDATVRVAWSTLPTQLDPLKSTPEPVDFRVMNLVYDRLLTISPTGEIEPAVATEWQYSPDGLTLALTLREDIEFRDGTPLDASAVVTNLERARNLGNSISQRLSNISNVTAAEPFRVEIALRQPTTEILSVLAQNAGLMLNPKLIENGDPSTTTDGSGPYLIENFESGSSVTLVRAEDHDSYWDQDAAAAARFEYTRIADPRALVNALRGGQVDAAQLAQPEQVEDLRSEVDRGDLTITSVSPQTGVFLYLNRNQGPLAQPEVRKAVNHAIDRNTLVENFYPGSEIATQFWRKNDPHFDEELADNYPFDSSKARELLKEAGFENGLDLGPILVSNSMSTAFAQSLQAMLADAGITTDIQVMDSGQIFAEYARGQAPLMLNYASHYGSPAVTMIARTNPAYNPAGTTPEYDALFSAANDNRISADEQIAGFRNASVYLSDEAWYAPIVWINFPWAHTPALRGFSSEEMDFASTTGPYDWRYVGIAQDGPAT
jgi:peptide/nickel transport system substrate-binding protein